MVIANHDIYWLTGPDFEKKSAAENLGPTGLNQSQNEVFCHFPGFGSLVFLENAYNDILKQCLAFSRGKTYEKNFWAQIWVKQAKIRPKIGLKISFFLPFSEV